MEHVQSKILSYLKDSMLVDIDQIKMDENLLSSGHIDSFSFIEMISFIEKEFQIKLSDDDIQKPEITTVSGITGIVESLTDQAA